MQLTMRGIVVVDVAQNQLLAIKVLPESDDFSDADAPAGLILEKWSFDDNGVAASQSPLVFIHNRRGGGAYI